MKQQTVSPAARKAERTFDRLDRGIAMLWRRSLALVCFSVAAYQTWGAWQARADFETLSHYLGTGVFIGAFVVFGVWLWCCNQPLSEALDDAGTRR